ncbi:30S ribosomal protein S8 [bacterium]|jgi:small subunit ribosomal protein S8|nr:30S ribosomal protein S8 [bacterium]
MKITDPIADLFCRIKNAINVKSPDLVVPFSKIKLGICKILKDEGFIKSYDVVSIDLNKQSIKIVLKYAPNGSSLIKEMKRVSKCSKRVYCKKASIPKVLGGFGISILSTTKGILDGKTARINNLGGELLGLVY